MKGYEILFSDNGTDIEMIVDQIFDKVDFDCTGIISKDDWIVATINKENILEPRKLKACFQYMDIDNSGSLDMGEFLETLF